MLTLRSSKRATARLEISRGGLMVKCHRSRPCPSSGVTAREGGKHGAFPVARAVQGVQSRARVSLPGRVGGESLRPLVDIASFVLGY